jgi:VIT1/CCC1 family predicted Fe2+/Mn2+ transporter
MASSKPFAISFNGAYTLREEELMKTTPLTPERMKAILAMQQKEITEYEIYTRIANRVKDEENRKILLKIGEEERRHAETWAKVTGKTLKPQMGKVRFYSFLARILGYTFVLKKMEMGEEKAIEGYSHILDEMPQAREIYEDEQKHEEALIAMLDEERLQYVGSMVLGLNDALVELSGTLAGLTFALKNTRLIALSGLITGISATLSMASSEYLSSKNRNEENAGKSAMYTGVAYLIAVAAMVLPYLLLSNYFVALGTMLAVVLLIIVLFTYYTSVAKNLPFGPRFREMAFISIGVSGISFIIGILVKNWLGIDI